MLGGKPERKRELGTFRRGWGDSNRVGVKEMG
jgi:hypothetical protein